MMFNGFLVYGDSDTSDVTKSSNEPLSLAESSTSDSTRALSLESQLHATRQILKNKEETVRVQAESLALAEARIAELSKKLHRAGKLPSSADTSKTLTRYCKCGEEKFDMSVSADSQEQLTRDRSTSCCTETADASAAADLLMDPGVVSAPPDKLGVVEELYRECFYEAAKQEEMIDLLRKSQLDLRMRDRAKADKICRLQRALQSHKWGVERYQDIADGVERLKSDIMSFINGSNHDSGVWGAGAGGAEEELAGGLRHVADQLLRLQDLLTGECTCGLAEENKSLRQTNDSLNQEVCQMRDRVQDLEKSLEEKDNLYQKYEKQIRDKDEELVMLRQRLAERQGSQDEGAVCDALMSRLQQLQGLLIEKNNQLRRAKECCLRQEETTQQLRDHLKNMEMAAKENSAVRSEVQQLAAQRQQARVGRRSQETEISAARRSCVHLRECSDKAVGQQDVVSEMQRCYETLCGTARRAVSDALHLLRQKQVEQDKTLKEQQSVILSLQESRPVSIQADTPSSHATRLREAGCGTGCDSAAFSHGSSHYSRDSAQCSCDFAYRTHDPAHRSRSIGSGQNTSIMPGSSHMAQCAESCCEADRDFTHCLRYSDVGTPPPVPPRKLTKKLSVCDDQKCTCGDDNGSKPRKRYTHRMPQTSSSHHRQQITRDVQLSPTAEILERVERVHEALESAQSRWGRHAREQRSKRL